MRSMIDVYRESLVSPVAHGGSAATGPSEYCPLGFRAQEREPGKDKQANSRLPGQNSPLSNYQLLSCEM